MLPLNTTYARCHKTPRNFTSSFIRCAIKSNPSPLSVLSHLALALCPHCSNELFTVMSVKLLECVLFLAREGDSFCNVYVIWGWEGEVLCLLLLMNYIKKWNEMKFSESSCTRFNSELIYLEEPTCDFYGFNQGWEFWYWIVLGFFVGWLAGYCGSTP